MVAIKEYNIATGHVETLTRVPDNKGQEALKAFGDKSTDHVFYISPEDES